MPGLELRGIIKTLGGHPVLQDFDLTVIPGEYLVVAGPSGSGKTTLLRLMAGLDTPDAGDLFWDGVRYPAPSGSGFRPAMVFQGGALYPHLTARENLEFSQRIRGIKARDRACNLEERVGWLGLDGLMDRLPEELSGGECQRVAIGRALMQGPSLLLLDEPLASLDAPLRFKFRTELRTLHRRLGLTVIHVTHDQEEAMAMGDRVALIHQGRLQQIDRPERVYRQPANLWSAAFLGSPPINLFQGEIRATSSGLVFAGSMDLPWVSPVPGILDRCPPINTPVTAGLRPESIRVEEFPVEAPKDEGLAPLEAELELVEFNGATTWWRMRRGDQWWTVLGTHSPAALPGSRWRLRIDWPSACWFDRQTGKAL